jgi:hypothetical protein
VLARHRSFPGNRPSTTFVLDALTPRSLGALIALYEHRVFTSGALWGINSFDQWGVELGKALCNQLLPRLGSGDTTGLDASTAGLLKKLRLDFGGVLFSWHMLQREIPHVAHNAAEAVHWVAQIFQGYTGDWGDFDRGAVQIPQLVQRIAKRTGLAAADVQTVVDGVTRELKPIPESVALLRELHAGGPRAVLPVQHAGALCRPPAKQQ